MGKKSQIMHGSYEDELDVAHNKELTNFFEDAEVSQHWATYSLTSQNFFWQESDPSFPATADAFGAYVDKCE